MKFVRYHSTQCQRALYTHTHTHKRLTAFQFFWDRPGPGELVPEENFWTLWCKGTLTDADTPTIRLGTTVQ